MSASNVTTSAAKAAVGEGTPRSSAAIVHPFASRGHKEYADKLMSAMRTNSLTT